MHVQKLIPKWLSSHSKAKSLSRDLKKKILQSNPLVTVVSNMKKKLEEVRVMRQNVYIYSRTNSMKIQWHELLKWRNKVNCIKCCYFSYLFIPVKSICFSGRILSSVLKWDILFLWTDDGWEAGVQRRYDIGLFWIYSNFSI